MKNWIIVFSLLIIVITSFLVFIFFKPTEQTIWVKPSSCYSDSTCRYEIIVSRSWSCNYCCEVEVEDHVLHDRGLPSTFYGWTASQVMTALNNGEVGAVSGTQESITACLSSEVWNKIQSSQTTTTTTIQVQYGQLCPYSKPIMTYSWQNRSVWIKVTNPDPTKCTFTGEVKYEIRKNVPLLTDAHCAISGICDYTDHIYSGSINIGTEKTIFIKFYPSESAEYHFDVWYDNYYYGSSNDEVLSPCQTLQQICWCPTNCIEAKTTCTPCEKRIDSNGCNYWYCPIQQVSLPVVTTVSTLPATLTCGHYGYFSENIIGLSCYRIQIENLSCYQCTSVSYWQKIWYDIMKLFKR